MRKKVTFTFDEKLIEDLKVISDKTLIPQSRLVEQALKIIIENHKKE